MSALVVAGIVDCAPPEKESSGDQTQSGRRCGADARRTAWNRGMTNGVAVELNGLTRVYGAVKALDGLTLHIEPGELVA
jgi:hypothetical protein